MKCRLSLGRVAVAIAIATASVAPAAVTAQQTARRPSAAAPARPLPVDPAVATGTLPNGVRYYVRANRKPEHRAELRLVVNAGSVLEDEDQRGLAHFVEHMAFNGTTHFAKQELVDYLERAGMRFGADLNAYTSFDETVYMLQVPTDTAQLLATGVQILEDWAHGVTFDSAEVEKERGVVIEEWRSGQGADARMRDKQFPILFKGSRYAERLPIGSKRSLETFDRAALVRFYREWYRPDLMAVVAVGDFDRDSVVRLIRRHFASIPPAKRARPRPTFPVPGNRETLVAIATDPEATGSGVSVVYKQPVRAERTVAAYRRGIVEDLYNTMLNDRLHELTQRPDAPFLGASSGQGRFVRSSEIYSLGAAVKDSGVERGLEALLVEAARVDRHGFTATELERARQDYLRGMEQAYAEREKTNSGRYAGEYVRHYLTAEPIPGIAAEYELARQLVPGVQLAEVNRLAREWITDTNRVILVNAPAKDSAAVPDERALLAVFGRVDRQQVAAYTDSLSDAPLVADPPPPARIVEERADSVLGTRTWTLENGARVVLKPTDFKADEIVFTAYSPGGTSLAPDSAYLSAALAAQVVGLGGVGPFSAIELQKKLAGKAVRVSPYVSGEYEGLGGSASPRDVETMFQLIRLYVTAPRRDSSAFVAFEANAKAALANRGSSPEAAFQDTLQVTLAQHHPRARPFTSASLDDVRLDQALDFYRDRFADASDFTFVFVGSFDPDSLRPLVQRYLATLPATRRVERWRDLGITPPTGVVERTVRRGIEPRSETAIVFTGPLQYTSESRFALRALADVLTITLREQLREELGGTYGVSVSATPSRVPRQEYAVTISFGAAPERVEQLTRAVFARIDTLKRDGASAKDLAKVKEMQIRARETSLKQNGYWLGQLAGYGQNGEDPRAILEYERLVRGLTAETVRDAARRYLREDNFVRVTLVPEKTGGAAAAGTARP